MTEKLKPCPFCGNEAEFDEWKIFCIRCLNGDCDIKPQTDWFNTKEEAIEAWNRRVNDESKNA